MFLLHVLLILHITNNSVGFGSCCLYVVQPSWIVFLRAAVSCSRSWLPGLLARSSHGRCWAVSLPKPWLLSHHQPWPILLQQLSRRACSTFQAVQCEESRGCPSMENLRDVLPKVQWLSRALLLSLQGRHWPQEDL